MTPFRKVLVFVGSDRADGVAQRQAVDLVRRQGGRVTLFGAIAGLPWYSRRIVPIREEIERGLIQDLRDQLEARAAPIRDDGVDIAVQVALGRPWLEAIREAIRGGYDLLLKDAEPDDRGHVGSTDLHLMRQCPCPVWLARPPIGSRQRPRILALVDPHPILMASVPPRTEASLNASILDMAASIAEIEEGELLVAHAWDAPAAAMLRTHGYTEEQVADYVDEAMSEARDALDRTLKPHAGQLGPEAVHLLRGLPEEAIPRFIEAETIDLVVMGTVARTGVAGLLMGNTAETILHRVGCSILAVKPEGFVSPVTADRA